jgi:hypothetical protein
MTAIPRVQGKLGILKLIVKDNPGEAGLAERSTVGQNDAAPPR